MNSTTRPAPDARFREDAAMAAEATYEDAERAAYTAWRSALQAVDPSMRTEVPEADAAYRAAILTAYLRDFPQRGGWELSALISAACEAARYPDPAALLPAVHHRHGSLSETQTESGCRLAACKGVAELAASLGQVADMALGSYQSVAISKAAAGQPPQDSEGGDR